MFSKGYNNKYVATTNNIYYDLMKSQKLLFPKRDIMTPPNNTSLREKSVSLPKSPEIETDDHYCK